MTKGELKREIEALKAEREILYQELSSCKWRVKQLKAAYYGFAYGNSPIVLEKVVAAL